MASWSAVTTTPQQLLAARCPDLVGVDRFEILEPELVIEASAPGAGNDSANNDSIPFYPASYRLPNMLVIAARVPATCVP